MLTVKLWCLNTVAWWFSKLTEWCGCNVVWITKSDVAICKGSSCAYLLAGCYYTCCRTTFIIVVYKDRFTDGLYWHFYFPPVWPVIKSLTSGHSSLTTIPILQLIATTSILTLPHTKYTFFLNCEHLRSSRKIFSSSSKLKFVYLHRFHVQYSLHRSGISIYIFSIHNDGIKSVGGRICDIECALVTDATNS